jgi:hypothetical protein
LRPRSPLATDTSTALLKAVTSLYFAILSHPNSALPCDHTASVCPYGSQYPIRSISPYFSNKNRLSVPASALVASAGPGVRGKQETKPKRRGTASNKIYPLRSLRCRGSSRARSCAAKIVDGAQAGRLFCAPPRAAPDTLMVLNMWLFKYARFYCVTHHQRRVNSTLRHATANVIFQSIKKTFEHPFSAEYPIQIFAPILVTTAKLRILNDDIKIEEIKKATEIEDISKTVESLLIIPPHNLSFDKYFSDLKSKYLTPYEKAMRNLYTALGKVKETDIIAQSIYPSMANFKLPNACQRILVVNLESLDKNLKTIHRRIQSAKKDLKTFGKVESVFFSEEYKIKPEL